MPLRERFRRAINRSGDRSNSSSGSSTNTNTPSATQSNVATPIRTPNPNGTSNNPISTTQSYSPPKITLTKTRSGLNLTKTLTFRSRLSPEEKERKRIEEWEKMDEKEWTQPSRPPGKRKSKAHQDLLRSFELNFKRNSLDVERRKDSGWSGISPGQSRVGSVASPRKEDEQTDVDELERVDTTTSSRSMRKRSLSVGALPRSSNAIAV